jgi:hypothetical protein
MHIAVVGGTGREGRGLALRWARHGHRVSLGSRDAARAEARAREFDALAPGHIRGGENAWAVAEAEVVVLSVPYVGHAATLTALKPALAGRVLIDITVPLRPPVVQRVHLPPGGAAALEAQALLGPSTPVASTLHHIGSTILGDPDQPIDGDVLVCADLDEPRALAMQLVEDLGARALDAGPLANAVALEALTPVLLHLNKRYRTPSAGLRITGL